MASPLNQFGLNPVILEVQATDTDYNPLHDAAAGTSDIQYSTLYYEIDSIKVKWDTGKGGAVILRNCKKLPLDEVGSGDIFYEKFTEHPVEELEVFPRGFWVNGIYPLSLPDGVQVFIYLR